MLPFWPKIHSYSMYSVHSVSKFIIIFYCNIEIYSLLFYFFISKCLNLYFQISNFTFEIYITGQNSENFPFFLSFAHNTGKWNLDNIFIIKWWILASRIICQWIISKYFLKNCFRIRERSEWFWAKKKIVPSLNFRILGSIKDGTKNSFQINKNIHASKNSVATFFNVWE